MTSVNDIIATDEQQHDGETTASAVSEGIYFPWLFITLVALVVFGAVAYLTVGDAAATPDAARVAPTVGAVWPS